MTVVSVEEAQPRLKELLKQAEDGEAVVITTESGVRLRVLREEGVEESNLDRTPVIEPGPILQTKRVGGQWAGRFTVGPEFFEPLPEEELALWLGESPRGRELEEIGKAWAARNGDKV